ncbi:PLC-like phosphodiesterase [Clavulina sp. PMI_390]|nr:PLC-like phosphodiesterase [Clavulina sp. PMI_390]
MLAQVASLFTTLLLALNLNLAAARSISGRASVCNGYSELCTKSYGNVTFVGAHDSYAVGASNIAANQDYNATVQLNDGIRLLQVQTHNGSDGQIHLCHTSCALLDAGTFASWLSPVKTWLEANPNEVVSILIVNNDDLEVSLYGDIYKSVGLDTLSYSPSSSSLASSAWPTLGSMIDAGTRLVTFMDFKADFTTVPYIIDEFTNVWETAFDVTDQTFDCNINRTGTADSKMYLINHFLDKDETLLGTTFPVPDKSNLTTTNAVSGYGSLGLQAQTCGAQWGKYPSFLLVDFYDYGGGSVFQVGASLNGVTYSGTSISPPITASTTTMAGGASSPTVSYLHSGSLMSKFSSFSLT